MLSNCHVYLDQIDPLHTKFIPQAIENVKKINTLPILIIKDTLTDLFEFNASEDIYIANYKHDPFVKFPVAV